MKRRSWLEGVWLALASLMSWGGMTKALAWAAPHSPPAGDLTDKQTFSEILLAKEQQIRRLQRQVDALAGEVPVGFVRVSTQYSEHVESNLKTVLTVYREME